MVNFGIVAIVIFGVVYAVNQFDRDRSDKAASDFQPPLDKAVETEMPTISDPYQAAPVAITIPPSSYQYAGDAPNSTDAAPSDGAAHPIATVEENRSDAIRRRRREVSNAFNTIGPKLLGERLDEFMSRSEVDAEWAPDAEARVAEWSAEDFGDPSYLANSKCVSQVCFVDVEMPILDFVISKNAFDRDKIVYVEAGFLPGPISVRAGENYIRMYFFRDTFEVSNLQ